MARATAAEKAFKAAQKAIAEAAKSGSTELWLHSAEFSALDRLPEEIAGLTGLTLLGLSDTKVSNLDPLRGLTGLTGLDLMDTGVSDLDPLRGLTGLTGLYLPGTGVSDLDPLRGLTGLTWLSLADTGVSDLEPLRGLTGLTELDLSGTRVSDLEPLRELTGLTWLDLSEIRVSQEALQAGLRGKISLIPAEQRNALAGRIGVYLKDCRAAREDARIAEIARIEDDRERTIALFEELGLEWREVVPDPLPQSDSGLRYAPDETGVISYDPAAAVAVQDAQQRQLHVLLREDAGELLILFGGGHNQPFARVTRKLERYSTGLGDDLDRLNPSLLWKTGNDLRLILQADKDRRPGDMTHNLPFDVDQRAGLEGLISAHNALVALHPALSKLDEVSVDPALRHVAERDRALMQAAIDAFAEQTRLIMAEVVGDLRNLHEEALGETRAAMRAGRIEVESLENLIKAIVTEAILEARGESTLSKLAGDVRAAAVGTVAVGAATLAGPQIAATYPQLVAALQPHIAALMAAWHEKDYPVSQAVEWVMRRFRG